MARERIRLTKTELEAVIGVAGDAEPWETLSDPDDETDEEGEAPAALVRRVEAYERGMDKLRALLARHGGAA